MYNRSDIPLFLALHGNGQTEIPLNAAETSPKYVASTGCDSEKVIHKGPHSHEVCDDKDMMSYWIIASGLVSLALFVLPFKRAKLEYVAMGHPRSLLQVMRKEARWSNKVGLKLNLLRLGFVLCLLVVFLPPAMLAQLQQISAQGGLLLRLMIIAQAIALLLGCALSVLAIVISDMVIGFGTPVRRSTITPIAWLIPVYEVSFALGAMVAAIFI